MAIPDSVQRTLDDMAETFDRKNADYATDSRPWTNFEESAAQVNQTPSQVVETLIAVKQSRLKQLFGTEKSPRNESVRDSLLDRAVYSVIALAMYDEVDSRYGAFEPVDDEWSDFSKRETVYTMGDFQAATDRSLKKLARVLDVPASYLTDIQTSAEDPAEYEWGTMSTAAEKMAEVFGTRPEKIIWDENVPPGSAFVFGGPVEDNPWEGSATVEAAVEEKPVKWGETTPTPGLWNVFETYPRKGREPIRWQVAPDGQIWHEDGKAYGDGLDTFENTRFFNFLGAFEDPQWIVEHEDFPGFLENLEWDDGGKEFARKLLEEGKTVEIRNNHLTWVFTDANESPTCRRKDGTEFRSAVPSLDGMCSGDKIAKVYHS